MNPYTTIKILLVCSSLPILLSCNKKFDEPPAYVPPNITADFTISDLKTMHAIGNIEQITIDKTISGVVIADDESGQFYKTIVIEDSTGGIAVKLDGYDLYTKYPIGRKVFIKVKGLYIGDYNRLIEIGGGVDNSGSRPQIAGIASSLFDSYIVKGTLNNVVEPKVVKVADLNDSYQNTLIELDSFEFASTDTSKTFADTSLNSSAVNFTIKSCEGENIILRNSSYADFAGYNVPNGNGNITAVYTVFGSTKQLNIRDTSDVKFYGARCGGGGNGSIIGIGDVRNFYKGSDVTLGDYKITGIVISDAASKNVSPGSIVLQDDDRGVALYFGNAAPVVNFHLGDSLLVDVSGGILTSFNGSLEIKLSSSALPSTAAGTGRSINAPELSIQQINSSLPDIEYTLVKIKDATASTGTYSGNKTLTDATGSITLYTSANALFANDALPSDKKTWTGYCNMFNSTKEFSIRNANDVVDDGNIHVNGDSDLIISEYISGSHSNKYIEIYNPSSVAADLSLYTIKLFTNGNTNPYRTLQLNALPGGPSLLNPGEFLVLQNSSASLALPSGVSAYSTSVCGFNGNDAVTLEKNGVVIDVFGDVGIDPGTSWTIAGDANAAVNKSVRRKQNITHGDTTWSVSAASEWDVISNVDDVSDLGSR